MYKMILNYYFMSPVFELLLNFSCVALFNFNNSAEQRTNRTRVRRNAAQCIFYRPLKKIIE
jgi:riboflavin transporter FmnP